MGSEMPRERGRQGTRGSVKSCLRTFEVIEYFVQTGAAARTSDISGALGIPNSSVDEILCTLAGAGYLTYCQATKNYAPSFKLVLNMKAIESAFFGGAELDRLLADVRAETGATVFLVHQNDCWLEKVAEADGPWRRPAGERPFAKELISRRSNSWRPGTNFAAAILAQQSNTAIVRLARRTQSLGQTGRDDAALLDQLLDRVSRTRSRGYSLCRRDGAVPIDSLAIPLPLPGRVAPHAIGVAGAWLFDSENDIRQLHAAMKAVIHRHVHTLQVEGRDHAVMGFDPSAGASRVSN